MLLKKVFVINIAGYRHRADATAVDPLPAEQFKAGQVELAQDLILKEQQIEYLVSMLPGLDNSEADQIKRIQQLKEELKAEEELHEQALKQHAATVAKVESIIRNVKRP
jgi:mediator of RNA polymerase II transcription subunit 21